MPRFTVHFEQWIQEFASVEIEASTPEEALKLALEQENNTIGFDFDWEDGSDSKDFGPTHVSDANDNVLDNDDVLRIIGEL